MPMIELKTDDSVELIDLDDVLRVRQIDDSKIEITLKYNNDVITVNESYDAYLARIYGNQDSYSYYKKIVRSNEKMKELQKKAEEFDQAAARWRNRDNESSFPF